MDRWCTKQYLYKSVDRLRNYMGIDHRSYHFNIRDIACNSAPIIVKELPFKTSGLQGIASISTRPDEPDVILLNSFRSKISQNFDFSHELIHCAYHRKLDKKTFSCYDSVQSQQDPALEWQANEGAAELLVPYRAFLPYVADNFERFNRYNVILQFIKEAALRFGVTERTIKIRLESLKFEIYQYRNDIPFDKIVFLSRKEQIRQNIVVESLNERMKRLYRNQKIIEASEKFDIAFGGINVYLQSEPTYSLVAIKKFKEGYL